MGQAHDQDATGPGGRGSDPDERDDGRHEDRDDAATAPEEPGGRRTRPRQDRFSRLILWVTAIVLGLVVLALAVAYLPGWWAHRVADVVATNSVAAVLGGLACGAVFSILPLSVARAATRPRLRWPARLVRLVEAVLLAVPNLLTVAVVTRGGQDGEVARAVLDVRAPGFAVSTLIGAVLGVAVIVTAWVLLAGRRRRLLELDHLRSRLELRDADSHPGDS